MDIKIKKVDERAKLPTRGSNSAAGYDLYALDSVTIEGGQTAFIDTGLSIEIPEGYFGAIYARSGLACKHNLRPANCVGIIDSDYRGNIKVALHNDRESVKVAKQFVSGNAFISRVVLDDDAPFRIEAGDRIAQLVVQKFEEINFIESDELADSERGEGGFGSTGAN